MCQRSVTDTLYVTMNRNRDENIPVAPPSASAIEKLCHENCCARSFIHSHALMQKSCAYFWRYVGPSRVCILIQTLEKLDTVAHTLACITSFVWSGYAAIRIRASRTASYMYSECCLSLNEIPSKWNTTRNINASLKITGNNWNII